MIASSKGVKFTVRKANFSVFGAVLLAVSGLILTACGGAKIGGSDPNEVAATVNGKAIKMESVERVVKTQAQGQESKLSPLELAQLRLQILQGLIQDEVLFQKAEKEGTVPTEEEVTAELNRLKTSSGKTQEQFEQDLKTANETEASLKETLKKQLAVKKLEDKITGLVEAPREGEIVAFYEGNKAAFVRKKGAKLAAIVIDPSNSGEGDATKSEADAVMVGNEVIGRLRQDPNSFSQIARERSEDQSAVQGGELGYFSEEQMKQTFPAPVVADLMSPQRQLGTFLITQAQGKFFILKLLERSDKDESLTLESPGVKQQVADSLINARKELLIQSFSAIAMNEAKIENFLAKKVVSNPNDLSGARPAGSGDVSAPQAPAANTSAAPATAPAAAPSQKPAEKAAENKSGK